MPTTTGHVGINVTSLDRSHDFYADVFGLTRIGGSDDAGRRFAFLGDGERLLLPPPPRAGAPAGGPRRFAFLGDGERLVLTLWEQSAGRFDNKAPGLHHLSF